MGCAAHGDTDAEALKELDVAMRLHLDVRHAAGLPIPKPAAGQENEGRVLLRLSKTLQRSLREAALAEGISVNQHALYLISMAHGQRHPV